MRRLTSFLISLCLILFPSLGFAARKTVVLTAFEPFDGASTNSSLDVARLIQDAQGQLGPDVEVQVCVLPVVFDQAAKAAEKCINALPKKPDMVISLGEGHCRIDVETVVHNLDLGAGIHDNSGRPRRTGQIERGAALSKGLTLPLEDWLCYAGLSQKEWDVTRLSSNPANFVCNNTAYRLVDGLQAQGIPYGFIHVPPQQTCKKLGRFNDLALVSSMIGKLIRRGLNAGANELVRPAQLPSEARCHLPRNLPINAQEVHSMTSLLKSSGDLCRKAVYEEMQSTLERDTKTLLNPGTFGRTPNTR